MSEGFEDFLQFPLSFQGQDEVRLEAFDLEELEGHARPADETGGVDQGDLGLRLVAELSRPHHQRQEMAHRGRGPHEIELFGFERSF